VPKDLDRAVKPRKVWTTDALLSTFRELLAAQDVKGLTKLGYSRADAKAMLAMKEAAHG
jgi:hypothetical protein